MENIIDQPEHEQEHDLKDWSLFIGTAADYYIPKWYEIQSGKTIISFNIAAFFLGILWMLFRKMYLAALVWLAIVMAFSFLEDFIIEQNNWYESRDAIKTITTLIIATFMGLFGNWIYYKSAERKIEKIRGTALGKAAYENELKRQGGINWWAPIIAVILYLVIFFLLLENIVE